MKKTLWIIGNIVMGVICLFLVLGLVAVLLPDSATNTEELTLEEISAYSYRASELYAAGIFYTDKALTTNPEETTYEEWKEYAETAQMYWNELDEVLNVIEANASTETLQKAFEKTEANSNPFIMKAYAYDSETIIKTFDSGKTGAKLKAVADLLGKDREYAFSALKTAQGEVTAESWNNYGDTAMRIEQGLRVAKTAGQGAALVAGVATGGATTALSQAVVVVNGASLIWQATDDGAFILMGDNYKNNRFVANLNKVSDFVAPIAFAGDMLTMDFSGGMDAVLSTLSVAETVRGMFQDGKVASIDIKGKSGNFISMTKDDLLDYQIAKENGQDLPDEIETLLSVLAGDKEFTVTTNKETVKVDEKVTFTVKEGKSNYTYIWQYGNNKNEQKSNKFTYSYQAAGTYTMKVTVKDENNITVGQGSCEVTVIEEPEAEPEESESSQGEVIDIKGTYGGSYSGTTSRITFNGDGTGRYVLTGNMTTDQSFTYTIVEGIESKGIAYRVKVVLEAGMTPTFEVYEENLVNGVVNQLNSDLPKIN